jgi:hypothetical protein
MNDVARKLHVSRITCDVHFLFVMGQSEPNWQTCIADRTFLERDFGCMQHVLQDIAAYTAPNFFPVHGVFLFRQISRAQIEVISRKSKVSKELLAIHLPIVDDPAKLEYSRATFDNRMASLLMANTMIDSMRSLADAAKSLASAARGGAPASRGRPRGSRGGGGGGGGASGTPRRSNTPRPRRGGGSPKRGQAPSRRSRSGSSRGSRDAAAR